MAQATITSKGQITIPLGIRKQLHLKTGDRLEFRIKDNELSVSAIGGKVVDVFGILAARKQSPVSVEQMNASVASHFRKRRK